MKRLTNTSVDSRNSRKVRLFCNIDFALKRLKEYEDTGLSPEEVKNQQVLNNELSSKLKEVYGAIKCEWGGDLSIEKLLEESEKASK